MHRLDRLEIQSIVILRGGLARLQRHTLLCSLRKDARARTIAIASPPREVPLRVPGLASILRLHIAGISNV
jgi:hypothetical protein